MNKYIRGFYYLFIKRNVLILRKLGKRINEIQFIFLLFILIIIFILLGSLLHLTSRSILLLIIVYFGAILHLPKILYENRIELLEKNIPKALYIMVISLESGRSIPEALQEVVKNNIKEVSDVFRKVLYLMENQKLTFEESISIVATIYDSKVLSMLSRIMIENKKYGGDLAESLKNLAKTLEDLQLYKRQLLSVTAQGLAIGFIILCGVMPAVGGLLGAYLLFITKSMGGMARTPPVSAEDIARGFEIIQLGTLMVGSLFSIPIYGFNIARMFLIAAITMTAGMGAYYIILKLAPSLFS
ncbi:type II secretion system F domain-containing protein [Methanocaldococcus villosus KIN24-T80]|uniref:Type II secretion system F domain-containing protein n=1 Tax=Methanocaldococcus villosus KIN24-T80 TaxID=1069083 RepID=N6VPB2_9EURY|nr:type II secretion system F family protein [Methanocaldococcus villosus]ENN95715.1 type II secretion system F domain-containing protein [Methanocaldococcus villosus KIN24-T80]